LRAGSGELEVSGKALRVGRQVAFAEAHARNGDNKLVGHATSSIAVSRP
jgi:acyl-coenzyme A thioesterase PaaI-like protein